MARGDYAGAEPFVDTGRKIGAFQAKLEGLHREWLALGLEGHEEGVVDQM